MQILTDEKGNVSGYFYNNVILLEPGHRVLGVVLAHCVFTSNGNIKGKFFKDCIYNEQGEMIARLGKGDSPAITSDAGQQIMVEAWTILARTKEHIYPWIEAKRRWSKLSLQEFLSQ